MSGSHHLLIPLGSSNLSAHYIPMYHCSSSTFSMQCHLLIDGIEPLIPYFPFSPFDSCHCITALPSCHVHQQYHTSKQTREREKERETRLRTMYYSHGTNLGPGSSSYRNHFSHNHIKIKGIKIIFKKHENTESTQLYQSICIKASIGPSNTTI